MREMRRKPSGPWALARRTVGLLCLLIWVMGVILPVIPGWPALVVAIALLGRRDRMLRLLHLYWRRTLRWLRRHPVPHVRPVGHWLSDRYLELRRTITPGIIAAERVFGA